MLFIFWENSFTPLLLLRNSNLHQTHDIRRLANKWLAIQPSKPKMRCQSLSDLASLIPIVCKTKNVRRFISSHVSNDVF
ncbi:hypothetical protein XcuCFBP2542_18465 [Xanthomonas cucurbitae]|uniref:Uncharacterized protein n=1 Tax=Xanthomonas cucurbitae TaxID=56453 RepID=A0A2S7DAX7_9XANT|nr:hypothetical protein XcuCFBP2542_18465 [Xanthomonas cucurbitae]